MTFICVTPRHFAYTVTIPAFYKANGDVDMGACIDRLKHIVGYDATFSVAHA